MIIKKSIKYVKIFLMNWAFKVDVEVERALTKKMQPCTSISGIIFRGNRQGKLAKYILSRLEI